MYCAGEVVTHPVLEGKLFTLRSSGTELPAFYTAMEEVGRIMGYELGKRLPTRTVPVQTSLGFASHDLLAADLVIVNLLGAGTPLMCGLRHAFERAELGFIGTARHHETLESEIRYVRVPELKNKIVILSDPMLATGGSIAKVVDLLEHKGPDAFYSVSAFAAEEGIERVEKKGVRVFAGAVDPGLNERGYIVPGCGDAGDRALGKKLDWGNLTSVNDFSQE